MNSRRSWLIFGVATFAYLSAVLQRSSLGVAGVDATERFGVSAALLSTLAVVQLIVYAGLQVPVGVVLDRAGPRTLILCGALLMAVGQTTLALAPSIGLAVFGRILVGAGDAMTFISVLRLLPNWFHGRTLPIVSQLLGAIGTLGQVLSAVPLSALLHRAGWTASYLSATSFCLVALVLVLLFVRNGEVPVTRPIEVQTARSTVASRVKDSLSRPGTRLGFWAHFVTQSSGTVFSLLWGFPFLSVGLGYGSSTAALLLTVLVASAMLTGPVLGILTARFPMRRSNVVLAIVGGMSIGWSLVLAWPGQPPLWTVVLLVVLIGAGGPGSLIGFDFARSFNPTRNLGSASGIVNVGGFLASFVMMFLIGAVLDLIDRAAGGSADPERLYNLEAFRLAFLVQYPVVGMGVLFLLRERRRTRERMLQEQGIQVAPVWVALGRAWRRRTR